MNPPANTTPKAILLIGIPAAGKTTFYEQHLAPLGVVHINLDTLRTRHREQQLLQECLANGRSFAVDNTNTLPQERARYISAAAQAGYRIEGYFLRSRVQECVAANATRKRQVPETAIAAMSARLVLPTYTEGFDALYYVQKEQTDFSISPWNTTT